MERITRKDAEQALRCFAARAGLPYGHYVKSGAGTGTIAVTQVGRTFTAHRLGAEHVGSTYVLTGGLVLDGAYGGYQVQQIIGMEGGREADRPCTGVRTPFGSGYRSAREIFVMLNAATDGLRLARADDGAKVGA